MDNEFITIGEAARFLKQADSAVMRLIKEALLAGVEKEDIVKAEMRQGRMMYLVSRTFLVAEVKKEKDVPFKKESVQEYSNEEKKESPSLLSVKDDMITILQKVIDTKDHQIEDLSGKIDQLIERDHETNILMKGLQDRLFLLEEGNPTKQKKEKEE
ncbi:hypothetical protein IIC44_00840 [Patescibacteria group bacterium]|nr:hypothetical protein [Patescibacteria group bacterium]